MHRSDFHECRSAQTIRHLHYIVWPVFFHGSCDFLKCLVRLLDTIQSEFQEVKALMARWIRDPCKEAMVIRKKCTGFAFKPPQWEGQNLFWDIPSRYLSTSSTDGSGNLENPTTATLAHGSFCCCGFQLTSIQSSCVQYFWGSRVLTSVISRAIMKPQNSDLTVYPTVFFNEKDLHGKTGKEALMLFILDNAYVLSIDCKNKETPV